jgi:hypothetical protein
VKRIEAARTVPQALNACLQLYNLRPLLGERVEENGQWTEYRWLSYSQVRQLVANIAVSLSHPLLHCSGLSLSHF